MPEMLTSIIVPRCSYLGGLKLAPTLGQELADMQERITPARSEKSSPGLPVIMTLPASRVVP